MPGDLVRDPKAGPPVVFIDREAASEEEERLAKIEKNKQRYRAIVLNPGQASQEDLKWAALINKRYQRYDAELKRRAAAQEDTARFNQKFDADPAGYLRGLGASEAFIQARYPEATQPPTAEQWAQRSAAAHPGSGATAVGDALYIPRRSPAEIQAKRESAARSFRPERGARLVEGGTAVSIPVKRPAQPEPHPAFDTAKALMQQFGMDSTTASAMALQLHGQEDE